MRAIILVVAVWMAALAAVSVSVSAVPVRHHAPHEQQVLLEQDAPVDPDTNRNTMQLIEDRGYSASQHKVLTADKYERSALLPLPLPASVLLISPVCVWSIGVVTFWPFTVCRIRRPNQTVASWCYSTV